ncbi:MAG: LytTR family transcriptional regulator [Bacteroidetes bacterium]|nr:LytTR family transcriptional regulator [Bacteroidota bacterium]
MEKLVSFGSRKELDPAQVNFLKADNNYTFIYLKDGSRLLTSTTLKKLENRLKSFAFLRPNRSLLVNIQFIKMSNSETLILENNDIIKISRRRQKRLIEEI